MNVNSTENVITTAMIGVSSGSVTWRNCCQRRGAVDAPRPRSSDGEIVCSPASSVIATNGTPRQTLAAIVGQPRVPRLAEEVDVACRSARASPAPS